MPYNKPRPIGHTDDDDEMPFWRYQAGCGCAMCLEYEDDMIDSQENDFWLDTSYDDFIDDQDDDWYYDE